MALSWARRIGNIRTPMPITNAELRSISAAPVTNIAVESLRSPELTMPVAMRLPTPYVKKPAMKRTPTIRAAWRTLESGRTAGGEVEWLEAGVPTAIAVFRCDMTAPFARDLGAVSPGTGASGCADHARERRVGPRWGCVHDRGGQHPGRCGPPPGWSEPGA